MLAAHRANGRAVNRSQPADYRPGSARPGWQRSWQVVAVVGGQQQQRAKGKRVTPALSRL